jgi:polyhydroxybutyrate depolymerase
MIMQPPPCPAFDLHTVSELTVERMQMTIEAGGRRRTLTTVGHPEDRARDLVLLLHGSKQDGAAFRRATGGAFDALAEGGGAVVAYLDGHRGNWNDARRQSAFPARLEGVDDVAFARQAIERIHATHGIDPRRVFVIGFSNGGQMAMRLVHEVPELLAGAAVVGAALPVPEDFLLTGAPTYPLPVLLIHGTRDRIAPYGGGRLAWWAERLFRVGGSLLSAPETAAHLAARNGITTTPRTTREPGPSGEAGPTWVQRTDHAEPGRPPVRLLTVHGGGHTVPGPHRGPFLLGRTERRMSTATAAAAFLEIVLS